MFVAGVRLCGKRCPVVVTPNVGYYFWVPDRIFGSIMLIPSLFVPFFFPLLSVAEGRPFAHDILFIGFAPVTASQLLIQYLYGLIRINRKVSATWSDVAVSR